MTSVRCLAAALLLTTIDAGAQVGAGDPAARRAAMQKLSFLVGEWSGDAWAVIGPGKRVSIRQEEKVRYAVGGQVLVIEGIGRLLTDGAPGDTAYHAFAVLDWLPERGYQLRSTTLDGRFGAMVVTPHDPGPGITWGFDVTGGKVRFTMTLLPDGTWNEKGEFSRDGTQWMPTMEMNVKRVSR